MAETWQVVARWAHHAASRTHRADHGLPSSTIAASGNGPAGGQQRDCRGAGPSCPRAASEFVGGILAAVVSPCKGESWWASTDRPNAVANRDRSAWGGGDEDTGEDRLGARDKERTARRAENVPGASLGSLAMCACDEPVCGDDETGAGMPLDGCSGAFGPAETGNARGRQSVLLPGLRREGRAVSSQGLCRWLLPGE